MLFKIAHGTSTAFKSESLFDFYVYNEDWLSFLLVFFCRPCIHSINFQPHAWVFYQQQAWWSSTPVFLEPQPCFLGTTTVSESVKQRTSCSFKSLEQMSKSTFKIKVTWVTLQRTDTVGPLGPRMANLNNHSLPLSLSISQAELSTVIPEKEFDPTATKLLY